MGQTEVTDGRGLVQTKRIRNESTTVFGYSYDVGGNKRTSEQTVACDACR